MTLKIAEVDADYRRVKLELVTSRGNRFFAELTSDSIVFRSDTSSSGALYGAPIVKTADDLLDWIGGEGVRKPFSERKQVKATRYAIPQSPTDPPATS